MQYLRSRPYTNILLACFSLRVAMHPKAKVGDHHTRTVMSSNPVCGQHVIQACGSTHIGERTVSIGKLYTPAHRRQQKGNVVPLCCLHVCFVSVPSKTLQKHCGQSLMFTIIFYHRHYTCKGYHVTYNRHILFASSRHNLDPYTCSYDHETIHNNVTMQLALARLL